MPPKTEPSGLGFDWGWLKATRGTCGGPNPVDRKRLEAVGGRVRSTRWWGGRIAVLPKTEPPGLGFELGVAEGGEGDLWGSESNG